MVSKISENNSTYWGLVGLVLAAAAAWIAVSRLPVQAGAAPIQAPQVGFAAPDINLRNAQDEAVQLSDFRGQPVIINLWASWCGPCRAEMPAIQRVSEEYADQGLVILAVNATNQDSQANAMAFVAEHRLTFPILFDIDGLVSQVYRLQALPSTYFVDQFGVIEEVVIGGPMAEALLRTRAENLFGGLR
jgi:thiol-disulfide isomerase/thioredoxin